MTNSQIAQLATSESEIRSGLGRVMVEDKLNLSEAAKAQPRATLPHTAHLAYSADTKQVTEEHDVASASATETVTTATMASVSERLRLPRRGCLRTQNRDARTTGKSLLARTRRTSVATTRLRRTQTQKVTRVMVDQIQTKSLKMIGMTTKT
jgi:hypothetical protein